jgi:hypothetical protein
MTFVSIMLGAVMALTHASTITVVLVWVLYIAALVIVACSQQNASH